MVKLWYFYTPKYQKDHPFENKKKLTVERVDDRSSSKIKIYIYDGVPLTLHAFLLDLGVYPRRVTRGTGKK